MKKILTKILDEINKETPRLDYIRGLIEASVEDDEFKSDLMRGGGGGAPPIINRSEINTKSDEETIPAAATIGRVANLS